MMLATITSKFYDTHLSPTFTRGQLHYAAHSVLRYRKIGEAAGRVTRADKARVVLRPLLGVAYAIARGECTECVAAIEIAAASGDAIESAADHAVRCGTELCLMLGALLR